MLKVWLIFFIVLFNLVICFMGFRGDGNVYFGFRVFSIIEFIEFRDYKVY